MTYWNIKMLKKLYEFRLWKFLKRHSGVIIPVVIFLSVLLIWWGTWKWIDQNISSKSTNASDLQYRGQFGDQFGAVNALFSGLAFAGIIFTILLQRRDLKETRRAMSQDRFDNTFFQLLQVHIAITEKINVRGGHTGKEAFANFNEYLKLCDPDFHVFCALQKLKREDVRQIIDSSTIDRTKYPALEDFDVTNLVESRKLGVKSFENFLDETLDMHENKVIAAYVKASSLYIDYFSHYFRNLYHILKFINESTLISDLEKISYSRFIRSQLSQFELVTLFYNSIAKIELPGRKGMELGHPKMGKLLQQFDTLQNLNPRNLIHPVHQAIFNKNNFKGDKNAN